MTVANLGDGPAPDLTGRQVRLAARADLPAVYALRHEVFVLGQGVPAELERDELDADCDHVVAVRAGSVVGTGRLLPGAVGSIGRLAVAAAERGRRTGAAVLARLEARAGERGMSAVQLHAQVDARGFYERAGYAAYGEVFVEAGLEHQSMRKRLSPWHPAGPSVCQEVP